MPKPFFYKDETTQKFPECDSGFGPRRVDPLADNPNAIKQEEALLNDLERNNLQDKNYLRKVQQFYKALVSHEPSYVVWEPYLSSSIGSPTEPSMLTIDRLSELPYLEEDEDYTRPTQHAFSSASRLIIHTRDLLSGALPDAFLMTTEKGGIEFYWKKPDFSVKLTIASSPTGTDYVYVREQGQSAVYEDVSTSALVAWLREYTRRN